MHAPAHGRFQQRKVVLLDDGLDDFESLESGVFEVAGAVYVAHVGGGVGVAACLRDFGGGFVFAREDTTSEGVLMLVGFWLEIELDAFSVHLSSDRRDASKRDWDNLRR